MSKKALVAAGLMILALVVAGCGGKQDTSGASDSSQVEQTSKPPKGADQTGSMDGMGGQDMQKPMEGMSDMAGRGEGEGGGHNEKTYDVPAGAPQVAVKMKDIKFEPARIELKVGEPIRFVVENGDAVPHDFMLMGENGFDTGALEANAKKEIGWIPEQAGTYQAYCSQPGHKEAGMTAELVVK